MTMNAKLMTPLKSRLLAPMLCAALVTGLAQTGRAAVNLVTDGTFTNNYNAAQSALLGSAPLGGYDSLVNWTTASGAYNLLFLKGTADVTGAYSPPFNNWVALYGPGNGFANGLPATDPAGGNFVALDSTYDPGTLSQTINGLISGDTYALTFYWAGAQQYGKVGATGDELAVSLGGVTQNTVSNSVPEGGFTGWQSVTFNYTATNSSELLSFLASGAPSGAAPPFALVGGITLSLTTSNPPPSVPDTTSTAALFGFSVIVVGTAARRFRPLRRN
jgi:hypothetical protein